MEQKNLFDFKKKYTTIEELPKKIVKYLNEIEGKEKQEQSSAKKLDKEKEKEDKKKTKIEEKKPKLEDKKTKVEEKKPKLEEKIQNYLKLYNRLLYFKDYKDKSKKKDKNNIEQEEKNLTSFKAIGEITELLQIKKTLKLELDKQNIPHDLLTICWKLFILLDYIMSETKAQTIDYELFVMFVKHLLCCKSQNEQLLEEGFHQLKCYRNYINKNIDKTNQLQPLIRYFFFNSLINPDNQLTPRKIKSAFHTITDGIKINKIYSDYLFNLFYFIYISSFEDKNKKYSKSIREQTTSEAYKKEEPLSDIQKTIFSQITKIFRLLSNINFSNNTMEHFINLIIITYSTIKNEQKEDQNKQKMLEDFSKYLPKINKKHDLFFKIIDNLEEYRKTNVSITQGLTTNLEKQKNCFFELSIKNKILMLLDYDQVAVNKFQQLLLNFYNKKLHPAINYIKTNNKVMLDNSIAFILDYIVNDNTCYSTDTKRYIKRIIKVIENIKKEDTNYNKFIKLFFDIIERYQCHFEEEWQYLYTICLDRPGSIQKLFSIVIQLNCKNKYKGDLTIIRNLCNEWVKTNNMEIDDKCILYWIRMSFETDTFFFGNYVLVCDKILNDIQERAIKRSVLYEEIIKWIKYYYQKHRNNEIWIKLYENNLTYIIRKMVRISIQLDFEFPLCEQVVLYLLTETKNLSFFKTLYTNIFTEDLPNLSLFLANSLIEYGNSNFSISKMQIVTDHLSDFFLRQKEFFVKRKEDCNNKEFNKIVELIVNYYIDSDCKLYLDKEKLKKQEYSQVRVDNNSNHIENKTEAIFNVYTLFDLLKDIFKSLSIQKEDNKNVFMKILVLLDKHISKSFCFFKNCDITDIIMRLNKLQLSLEQQEISISNYYLLSQILHFYTNIVFHIESDIDLSNPYQGQITTSKYNLFKQSKQDNKIVLQCFLEISINNVIDKYYTSNKPPKGKEKQMSAKKEKQQEQLKEKEKEKNNVNKYLIDLLHSSEFLFFSTFDYEKDEQIETVNLFPLMLNDNNDVINKNNILNQLLKFFQQLFTIRNNLTDNDFYIGYALIEFLFMNKELICKFDILIVKSIILLLSLGWIDKIEILNDIIQTTFHELFPLDNKDKKYLSNNKFSFGNYFGIVCDNMINYFSEKATSVSKELLTCFNSLFNQKEEQFNVRENCIMEMIRWNLASKNQRDSPFPDEYKTNKITRIYIDKLKVVTILHDKANLNKFDVEIRSPIAKTYFTIEKPIEESESINHEQTYQILNNIVNGVKEEDDEKIDGNKIEEIKEKEELSKEQIEEIIQNNSFLFQRIYKFSERIIMKIPTDPELLDESIKDGINKLDSIPLYRLFECRIINKSENGEINMNFIQFINALGDLISTEEELQQQIVKIQYQDINNLITFIVKNHENDLKPTDTKIELTIPKEHEILLFNYVTIIWKDFYTSKIGKQLSHPVCIVIKPYSETHYRIKIKISSNLDEKFKKIHNYFMNNLVIYVGKEYGIIANYIIKLVIFINTIIFSLLTRNKEELLQPVHFDNIFKRYFAFDCLSNQSKTKEKHNKDEYLILDKTKLI